MKSPVAASDKGKIPQRSIFNAVKIDPIKCFPALKLAKIKGIIPVNKCRRYKRVTIFNIESSYINTF